MISISKWTKATWIWWWVLITAKVDNYPRHIAQESDWNIRIDKHQQRLHHIQRDNIVTEFFVQNPEIILKLTEELAHRR